jgi:STE24 endopeptidase
MSEISLDVERQQLAKEYARIRRRLMVLDLIIGVVYVSAWLVFGWSKTLKELLSTWTTNEWLLVAGFGLVFGGIYFFLTLPVNYYSGFILPHRYGLSTQTLRGWIIDLVKGVAVSALLGGIILEVIYAILRAYPDTWWLIAAGVLLLFTVILSNLAPVLLMPIFYKFTPLQEDHAQLVSRLLQLADKTSTRVQGVYEFDMSSRTTAANAALVGLGNTRRIILGDTLLAEFTPDEIETVLAHELGHHVHKDIPLGILFESLLTVVGLYIASVGLSWGVSVFGFESPADIAALPLFMLVIGAYSLITMPLGNAFSRWREHRADEFALRITGKGEAYAAALTRLANQNLGEADPEPWVEFLLYSHPALNKRISMAESAVTGLVD